MTPPHQEFSDDHVPLAYFITFRSYGTWLHGDRRGSVDRRHRRYRSPLLAPDPLRESYERNLLKSAPVKLTKLRREAIERGNVGTCLFRNWRLWLSIFAPIMFTWFYLLIAAQEGFAPHSRLMLLAQ
jgi:hypothetical protein